jgi:hypothetical protein
MSNLVFITGDYCSGSTLVYTLFRKSRHYYCLYEPLHERLREYLILRPNPDPYDHHFFLKDNYAEMAGFDRIADLHNPRWGNSNLYLPPDAEDDHLYRYMTYLIGSAFGRSPRVLFKENRIAFRLGWIRAKLPHARIVHIFRDPESQWRSNVRRVQEYKRTEDIGQNDVTYNGFNVATFCEDLKTTFPELDARNFKTGYERFRKLWELSFQQNQRHSDISINYRDLMNNFEATWTRVWECIGAPPIDIASLRQYVVPPEMRKEMVRDPSALRRYAQFLYNKWGFKYARARLRAQNAWRRRDSRVEPR